LFSYSCKRYAQLIYEDLVTNPVKTLIKLYHKLELPIDKAVIKAALRHLGEVPDVINGTNSNIGSYMSVYRGPQHDMNAWEYKMKKNDLVEIEAKCLKVFQKFGYLSP